MKKKILITAVAAIVAAPMAAMAVGGNHPMAGCGLGYVLFGHNDNSQIMQILAATTNGISGNQTFGMTTGTSGCTEDGAVKFVKEVEVFADVNLDTLRREMAAGEGEFVRTFAALLGAEGEQVDQLVATFHKEYATLFPAADTTSADMLAALSTVLTPRA